MWKITVDGTIDILVVLTILNYVHHLIYYSIILVNVTAAQEKIPVDLVLKFEFSKLSDSIYDYRIFNYLILITTAKIITTAKTLTISLPLRTPTPTPIPTITNQ